MYRKLPENEHPSENYEEEEDDAREAEKDPPFIPKRSVERERERNIEDTLFPHLPSWLLHRREAG